MDTTVEVMDKKTKDKIEKMVSLATKRVTKIINLPILKDSEERSPCHVEFSYKPLGSGLPSRSFSVTKHSADFELSHGTHSPSNVDADTIQLIFVGKLAEIILKENNK